VLKYWKENCASDQASRHWAVQQWCGDFGIPSRSDRSLVQVLLETRDYLSDLFRSSQVGHCIRDGVVVLEPQ